MEDKRVLIPEFGEECLEDFMVQNVTGNETILSYDDNDDDSTRTEEEEDTVDFQGSRFAPPWDILVRVVMSLNVQTRCAEGSYHEWTRVGWAIAGVAQVARRADDGFDLWTDFCRQCPQAYQKNPLKTWQVYRGANSRGDRLGWKSLMELLKVDNVDVHNEIRGQLGSGSAEVITDEHQARIITNFIYRKFSCRPSHVTSINVRIFDERRLIFVNTDETYCSIIKGEHLDRGTTSGVYFMLGIDSAAEKCRHPECRSKSGLIIKSSQYDAKTAEIVNNICTVPTGTIDDASASSVVVDGELNVSNGKDYISVKREFEKEWFRLFTPPVFINIDGDEIEFRKKSELKHIAGLLTFEEVNQTKGGNKRVDDINFLEKWLKDPSQRTYKRIDFLPPPLTCNIETTFNTFPQLAAERLSPNSDDFEVDLGPIMSLLYDLCDREERPAEYILSWMADIVQRPGQLSKVGIIMQSKQGRGKNLLFGGLFGTQILGQSLYFSSADPEDFFGRFATGRFKRLLSNFNEIECNHTSKIMGKVKEAITEPTVTFEAKGVMTVGVRNCARQLWFSNELMPIRIPHDDRRWLAVKASNDMPETGSPEHRDYFREIGAWVSDTRNVRAFYEFLRDRDLSEWHPDFDRPTTTFYTGLQQLSLNRVEQWLIAQLEDRKLPEKMLSETVMSSIEKMFPNSGLQFGFTKQILIAIPGIRYGTPTIDRVKGRGLYFVHAEITRYYVSRGFMTDPTVFIESSDSE